MAERFRRTAAVGALLVLLAAGACGGANKTVGDKAHRSFAGVSGSANAPTSTPTTSAPPPALDLLATPQVDTESAFKSISCLSPSDCVTVGPYSNSDATAGGVVVGTWDGSRWRTHLTVSPANDVLAGVSVSCPAVSYCVVVGNAGNGVGAWLWNGATLTPTPVTQPPGVGNPTLQSVSCTSPSWCMAVGYGSGSALASMLPFSEIWNGSAWSAVPTPNPTNAVANSMLQVSCSSPTWCAAVGLSSDQTTALVDSAAYMWNGSDWTTAIVTPSQLNDVFCTAPTWCEAVGQGGTAAAPPETFGWNGSAWTAQPSQNLAPGSGIYAVWCSSAADCIAAGAAADGNSASAATTYTISSWDGSRWSAGPQTTGPDGDSGNINGISCTDGTCMIAASYIAGNTPPSGQVLGLDPTKAASLLYHQ